MQRKLPSTQSCSICQSTSETTPRAGEAARRGCHTTQQSSLLEKSTTPCHMFLRRGSTQRERDLPLGNLGLGGMFFFGGRAGVSGLLLKGSSEKPPPPAEELNGSGAGGCKKEPRTEVNSGCCGGSEAGSEPKRPKQCSRVTLAC